MERIGLAHVDAAQGRPLSDATATASEVRAWARTQGLDVSSRGRLSAELLAAFGQAHHDQPPRAGIT